MARPALAGSVTGVAQVQWEDEDEEDEAGDYEEVLWWRQDARICARRRRDSVTQGWTKQQQQHHSRTVVEEVMMPSLLQMHTFFKNRLAQCLTCPCLKVRPLANEQHPAPARAQADEQYGDWPRTETSAGAAAGEAVVAADLVTAGSDSRVADSLAQSVLVHLLLVTGKEGSCR
nr:uncharacterized protein LOC109769627 [Aegilops tauschii subsp. strangulata]